MPAAHTLQPWTYHCLLGLLAVAGLRISEALNLRGGDIDWSEGVLTIHDAKFRKSRVVPLHASSLKVLSDYAVRRNHLFASQASGYFFPSRRGARLDEGQVRRTFYALSRQIGIRGVFASRGPRLHDFRHNAGFRKMPNRNLKIYRKLLESKRMAISSRLRLGIIFDPPPLTLQCV